MYQFGFKLKWYNAYEEKEYQDQGIIIASDYIEAMNKIYKRFPDLIDVYLHEDLEGDEFVFMKPKTYAKYVSNDYNIDKWD